ncbi:TPA: hypothetical protein ACGSTL_001176 [Vibrio parahaemolyticus]|uniref:hypothetical protein n=1 Tax=Vibrio campbellii TaxID=680 RepID=UPI001F0870FA|nr:hypothetical protein [Vibrio campbellii]UMM06599.1 hypothetical protein MKR81_27000 [Vibrio campbellii]
MRLQKLAKVVGGVGLSIMLANAYADPLLAEAERLAATGGQAKEHIALTGDMSNEDVRTALANFNKLSWTHILPVNNLVMVENQEGEKILMDTTARIAIRGNVEVYDMWNKRPINTLADAQASWLVTLDKFNINSGDLASYRYGLDKDKPDVTVMVDPRGDYNKKLFDQMREMAGDYSFEIVLLPLLGDESVMESLKLWCAKDQEKSLAELMDGKTSTGTIIPTCDKDPLIRGLGLGGLLHIKGLPYLIRADGLQNQGAPNSLTEFMGRETENLGKVTINETKQSQ